MKRILLCFLSLTWLTLFVAQAQDTQTNDFFSAEKISEIRVIDNIQSMVILSTVKDSKMLPTP